MKKSIVIAAAMMALLSTSSAYARGQIQGDLDILLTIGEGCAITNGSTSGSGGNSFGKIDFGTQSSLTTSTIDAQSVSSMTGSIQMNCTKDVPYTVSLNSGRHASSGKRNMKHTTAVNTVAYDLYQDAARTKVWDEQNPLTGKGTGTAVDLTVYGRVPKAGLTPPAGQYSDTVLVTIAW